MNQSQRVRQWLTLLMGVMLACGVVGCESVMTDELCRESTVCARQGRCTASGTTCVATTDDDCRNSRLCISVGECYHAPNTNRCHAKDDADCRKSTQCKENKRCIALGGECVVLNQGYCSNSTANKDCETKGKCSLDSRTNQCVAKSDADCARGNECKTQGFCSYDATTQNCIVKTDADCLRSSECTTLGRCGRSDVKGTTALCIVRSHDDCIQSAQCKDQERKACAFDKEFTNGCISGQQYCSTRIECIEDGHCSWDIDNKRCIVKSDEDCQKSEVCSLAKRCKYRKTDTFGPACVREDDDPCVSTTGCLQEGLCTTSNDKCTAASDADCALSKACRLDGKCKVKSGACVIDNCTGVVCTTYGKCLVENEKCVPTDNNDCAKSKQCRLEGKCIKQGSSCEKGGEPAPESTTP